MFFRRPTCVVEVQEGGRGRWRWQARVDNNVFCVSPVYGFNSAKQAEGAAKQALRGWRVAFDRRE